MTMRQLAQAVTRRFGLTASSWLFLLLEGFEAEFFALLDRARAAAAAATPVHETGVGHFVEILGDHGHQVALRLDHATAPRQLAGIVESQAVGLHALGLEQAGEAEFFQHLDDVLHLET